MQPRNHCLPVLATAGAAALCALPAWAQQPAPAERPNILVILSDDQGYADTGFQGSRDIPTPNLDRLAARGVRCTAGYVTHPYCSPSRAGLLTGRHQARFGHDRNPRYSHPADPVEGLPLSEHLLPEFLAQAGYATGWVGKWHLGAAPAFLPQNRGFQETFGFYGGGHHYRNWKPDPQGEYDLPICRNGEPVDVKEHLTVALGHEAAAFIGRHPSDPWFLYLAFNAPHVPNQPTPERLARFAGIRDPTRRAYAAQVSLMDDAIGEALDALKKTGQEQRTLVFFLSDNGGPTIDVDGSSISNGSRNAPLRAGKGHLYEGGVRVPFVVSWPAGLPAGKDYNRMVSSLDIFATALACAGVPMPTDRPYDGVNLIPFLTGKKEGAPHESLFWRRDDWHIAGMRQGDLKLIRDARRPDQLFNLTADIGEKTDVAGANPQALNPLENAMDAWMSQMSTKVAFRGDQGIEMEPVPKRHVPTADSERPKPSAPQLAWQQAELGVIFHYDPRIFDERTAQSLQHAVVADPEAFARKFNPAKLDTDQWVATAQAMGARFAILVAKHETGFCLWPSDANPYSLKMLDWRNGQGDIVRDFVASCRKYGLKPAVYTEARWDARLGVRDFKVTPKSPVTQADYNRMVEREVEELCTRYGELFEIWFDGGIATPAQGGPDVLPIVQKHQPHILFYHSDQRRDARWGGTETGTVGYPCWATVVAGSLQTQAPEAKTQRAMKRGDPVGAAWCPAMSDSPLRCENGHHDWFWAEGGEAGVASLQALQKMYYQSVGRNSTLILGLTPDRSGLVPEADAARCRELGDWIGKTFGGKPLAETSGRGAEWTLELNAETRGPVTHIVLQEDIRKGERVREYVVEAQQDGAWEPIARGTCIGQKRIEKIEPCSARAFRLRVTQSDGIPEIQAFQVR